MEKKTYKIVNLPGLSGLYVVGVRAQDQGMGGLIAVMELINAGIVVGDRQLRYPLPVNALWIEEEFLEETDDIATREFTADNPFGDYMYEGRFEKDGIVIAHTVFSDAISVTIFEENGGKQKTLYTGSFFEKKQMAAELIDALLHGQMDPEDVIFELKSLEGK